jgi:uncharacterized membrane protein HdeD (DUF308 family)
MPMLAGLIKGTRHVGWALVLFGVVAALAPLATGTAVMIVIGLALLAGAALLGLFGMRAREVGIGWSPLVLAAVAALVGVVLVFNPSTGLSIVRLLLMAYFLLSGLSEIATAWELRGEDGWVWMLFAGVVSLLALTSLWSGWPVSGAHAVGLLVGINLASLGWAVVQIARRLDAVGDRLAGVRARLR